MNALINHAKRELDLIGMQFNPVSGDIDENMNSAMTENILELLRVFSEQGHSGFSAEYCITFFSKLARYETLSPLTGGDDEWVHIGNYDGRRQYQNNRSGNVFKEIDSEGNVRCYQSDRYIFTDENGSSYTSKNSRYYISEWPYNPVHEYAVNDNSVSAIDSVTVTSDIAEKYDNILKNAGL